MDMNEAAELRRQWGGKPCNHPHVVRESYNRGDTGDYVCTTCGEVGWGKNWVEEERAERERKKEI